MKMHAIIIKQGFVIIVAFCYNICLFRSPVITILKLAGCEDCVRESKSPVSGGLRAKSARQFLQEKNSHFNGIWITYCMFLEQMEKAKLLRFGRVCKNLFCSVQSATHKFWYQPHTISGQVQNTFTCSQTQPEIKKGEKLFCYD